jgi:hypothetical protein
MKHYVMGVLFPVLFILHAVEEYVTNFYSIDDSLLWFAHGMSATPTVAFFLIQAAVLVVLLGTFFLANRRVFTIVLGILVIAELSHVVAAFQTQAYYPGLYTAVVILTAGGLYLVGSLRKRVGH